MDNKIKIALFSPLKPVKSGIADYVEEMLFELAEYMNIDILVSRDTEPETQKIKKHFKIIPFEKKKFRPDDYDEIVFQMGNSYLPHKYMHEAMKEIEGIVVLHDYVLQGFYAGMYFTTRDFSAYSSILKKFYGYKGEKIAKDIASRSPRPIWDTEEGMDYPLNEEVISSAKALIVHSDFVRNKIKENWDKPVITIPSHSYPQKSFDIPKTRKELGLSENDILIGSFGFINWNKRFHIILPAIAELNIPRLRYLIVGEDGSNILQNLIDKNTKNIIHKSYIPLEDFEKLINACDICINLRYPTMGETSGSLIRMMGYGKPVLVTNVGNYAEFPDHCVFKIDPDIDEEETIKRSIHTLIQNADFRESMGREAANYIQETCSIPISAKKYADFIHHIHKSSHRS
jgi:glycosyltransferase involved in cell wall biosynthesis